jgi:hypothetical protein
MFDDEVAPVAVLIGFLADTDAIPLAGPDFQTAGWNAPTRKRGIP